MNTQARRIALVLTAVAATAPLTPFCMAADWQDNGTGFAQLLSHEAYNGPAAGSVALDETDPFEIAFYRATAGTGADIYFSQVEASFDRIMDHTPYAGPTEGAATASTPDPVLLAINAALNGAQENTQRYAWQDNGTGFSQLLSDETDTVRIDGVAMPGEKDPFEVAFYAAESTGDAYFAQVNGSFERLMEHSPYGGPTAGTASPASNDPVSLAINLALQGGVEREAPFGQVGALMSSN